MCFILKHKIKHINQLFFSLYLTTLFYLSRSKVPFDITCHICDAIKQNESELGKIKTEFSFSLYATIAELYHAKTPSKLNIRFQRYSYFSDAQNNKIQRKFNISEFRLILLDHVTNVSVLFGKDKTEKGKFQNYHNFRAMTRSLIQ